jgi:hypothetical protein
LDLILQETTLNKNKKEMQNMPPTERARIKDWSPLTLADIEALLGVVINMGLHTMIDLTDYFSQAWVNKMPFFSDVFPRDEFLLVLKPTHERMTTSGKMQKATQGRPSNGPPEERLIGDPHFIERKKKGVCCLNCV